MGLVKEKLDDQKLRGSYYTPRKITQFLCNWAITENTQKILEPSCGDGNFIEAAIYIKHHFSLPILQHLTSF